MIDITDLCCSACGGTSISPGTVSRGIDNRLLGMCHDCAPAVPVMPERSDHSRRAEKSRRTIVVKTQIGTYRTKLTPLMPRAEFQPRAKRVAATPLQLFDK